jgi:YaaC-like Protein
MLASNPWRCMELQLSRGKHEEARAYLRQGRDFFTAAESAVSTARPLLLYYGFLNLAKALVKVRSAACDLSGAMHGVREPSANRRAQRFRLTSQGVEIDHPRNNRVSVLNEFANVIGSPVLPAGGNYNVCELLGQVPSIHRAFSHIRLKMERLHLIVGSELRFDQAKRQIWAIVWVKQVGGKRSGALRALKQRQYFTSFFTQVESNKDLPAFETSPVRYGQNPRSALQALSQKCIRAGVCWILTADGYRYYLANTQPAVRVHQAIASYLSMLYFGFVARYRPYALEKTLDQEYAWAIEEFLSTEARQFIYFIANSILNREVVRTRDLV